MKVIYFLVNIKNELKQSINSLNNCALNAVASQSLELFKENNLDGMQVDVVIVMVGHLIIIIWTR